MVFWLAISTLVSSQLILGLYALVLIYILLSLRSLKDDVAQVAQATTRPTRRKHARPQPVYDANDRLIGYFRGDRKSDITFRNIGRATTDSVLDGAASAPTSPESRPAPAAVSPPSPIIFQPPQVHVYRSLQASEWNG
ncbi:hypothetical protein MIND_00928300 [Mycena indigotica]|uniref:Uncharacterized protein n=1 Tax=Mycena indigotica TaxID=2126181 RepID=A0A8H6SDI5_9AGAR|nr:uncharacterized protein MIND_00928300 [Mycena indigotica]KAF7296963.1 hypothetical protein MIND_00928300 [Mycena indigotica]